MPLQKLVTYELPELIQVTSKIPESWSGRRDSNPRPQPWQGCALPLSYARILAAGSHVPARRRIIQGEEAIASAAGAARRRDASFPSGGRITRFWGTSERTRFPPGGLMTPQEKELITQLLERLKQAGGQPKDP